MFNIMKKLILPPGPLLSITLVGMMLLGGMLYMRAIRFQRFVEPALAITQPRNVFTTNVEQLLLNEFSSEEMKGIRYIGDSIYVENSLLQLGAHRPHEMTVLKKMGRIFLAVLNDSQMRPYVDMILVSTILPISADRDINLIRRKELRDRAGLILNSLYREEPELEQSYSMFFASTVTSAEDPGAKANWVEFRVVNSQLFHIEVLQQLQKYVL